MCVYRLIGDKNVPRQSARNERKKRIMSKRTLMMVIAMAMSLMIATTGTIAYLQDTDSAVNVMTLGKVEIEQIEQERKVDETTGAFLNELQEFSQAKPAYPVVGEFKTTQDGVTVNEIGYSVFDMNNVTDKIVTVKNTGKSDAFVRTIVAVEAPAAAEDYIITHSNSKDFDGMQWEWYPINEGDYIVAVYTYKDALEPGKTSVPSLMQVFLDSKADNDSCEALGDTWDILVVTQAVQAAGFADAETALNTAFGKPEDENVDDPTKKNVQVWLEGLSAPKMVSDAEGLKAALDAGEKNVILNDDIEVKSGEIVVKSGTTFDGGGNEIATPEGGISTKPILTTTGGTIKNVVLDGSGESVQGAGAGMTTDNPLTEDLYLQNVTIDNVMYAVIGTANDVKVVVTDSKLYGAFSYPGASSVEVENTTLGCGKSMMAFFEVAGNTSFADCTFEDDYCFMAYTEAAGKTVTFTNCTVNGEKLTAANFKSLLVDTRWDGNDPSLDSENLKNCKIIIDGVEVVW